MFEIAVMLGIIFLFFYSHFGPEEKQEKKERDQADRIHFGRLR